MRSLLLFESVVYVPVSDMIVRVCMGGKVNLVSKVSSCMPRSRNYLRFPILHHRPIKMTLSRLNPVFAVLLSLIMLVSACAPVSQSFDKSMVKTYSKAVY